MQQGTAEIKRVAVICAVVQHGRMRFLAVAALAATISLQLAQPAATAPFQPVEKWVVDFGEDRCVAYRSFGDAKDPVHLLLKPSPVGDVLQLQIAEKGSRRQGVQEKASIAIGNTTPEPMLQLQYGASGQSVRMINLSKEQTARLSAATTFRWSERGKQFDLAIGPMTKLIETVGKCKEMLADHWNASLTKRMALKEAPSLDKPIMSLFSTDDYPWDAVRQGQSGLAHVVVLVDENGRMADCTLIATSGIAVLDAQTCIILRNRGKFAPAIGADGKPTKGTFHQRVNWEMP
jgi:TonB family protein